MVIFLISSTQNKSIASEALTALATRGRPLRIGVIYATQIFSQIDQAIQTQTKFLFTFKNLEREAATIQKTFGLREIDKERIMKLDKFEGMAISQERPFICYNGEEKYETEYGEVKVGKALPTLSYHKPPFA